MSLSCLNDEQTIILLVKILNKSENGLLTCQWIKRIKGCKVDAPNTIANEISWPMTIIL